MSDPRLTAEKLVRHGDIRKLLMNGDLSTQRISDALGVNVNTLRHALIELTSLGHITCKRVLIRRALSLNVYTITAAGRIAPNPVAVAPVADIGCKRDCLVAALYGDRNISLARSALRDEIAMMESK